MFQNCVKVKVKKDIFILGMVYLFSLCVGSSDLGELGLGQDGIPSWAIMLLHMRAVSHHLNGKVKSQAVNNNMNSIQLKQISQNPELLTVTASIQVKLLSTS